MFDRFDPKIISDNMRILFKWFEALNDLDERDNDIIALNFVLFTSEETCANMRPYEFYMHGCRNYSCHEDDWAGVEDYVPTRLAVSPTLWIPAEYNKNFALHYMRALLYHSIGVMRHLRLLNVYHITVGYPTGVLLRVRDMGHPAMNEIRDELFDFKLNM
ncbi:MAG: hypothetical protein R3Y23_01530 [Bacillota bacterium]